MPIPLPRSVELYRSPNMAAVTPSDTVNFDEPSHVFVGVGGVVAAVPWFPEGASAVNVTVPTGGYVPCLCRRVNNTNTTATTMVRVY